jgi:hypothetical protein
MNGGPGQESAGEGDEGSSEPANDDGPSEGEDDEDAETSLQSGTSSPQHEDQVLDLADRHPMGVVVELHEMRFEGNQILLDVEVTNGSNQMITLASAPWLSDRIRLLDDLGGVYELQATDEERAVLRDIPSGDGVQGTLAFQGPIDRSALQLRFVVNLSDPEEYDSDDRRAGLFPVFLMGPIHLDGDA